MPFALDRPNSDKPTFIFLLQYTKDGRLKYSTGEKVLPTDWPNRISKATKLTLARIEQAVANAQVESRLTGRPLTKQGLKSLLDSLQGRRISATSFYEVVDKIINDRKVGKVLTPAGKKFSAHTIKGYVHSRDNLYRFDPKMTFEGITIMTYEKLISYYNERHDHALNSLGKTIKNWRVFLSVAFEMGINTNPIFKDKRFRVPAEDTFDIYLTEKELDKIYNHNFSVRALDLARDWFIIDCFTGLRISDIQLLSKENIEQGYIRLANEKTGITVMVPVHRYVKAILKKWKGLPRKITDQRMNTYLKDIAQMAGIKGRVLYSVTKGGERKNYYYERWQMVSNHTARRSFITNLLKAGVSLTDVMRLAGIKKLSTVQKYYKETIQEVAEKMKEHRFFK